MNKQLKIKKINKKLSEKKLKTNLKKKTSDKKKAIKYEENIIQLPGDKISNQDNNEENNVNKKQNSSSSEAFIPFFYTTDKFINQFEDKEIILKIQKKFPLFLKPGIQDLILKKQLVSLIQDKDFLSELMDLYDMDVQDFFKFLFRQESSIFKGPFLGKLQRILKEKKYLV